MRAWYGKSFISGFQAIGAWSGDTGFLPTISRSRTRSSGIDARFGLEYFDAEGVRSTFGTYNPVSIAQYGLYCYGEVIAGNEAMRIPFFRQTQFLRRYQRQDGTLPYWKPFPRYHHPPWISAMAQGEAASLFLRAYSLTSERSYLDAALRLAGLNDRMLHLRVWIDAVRFFADAARRHLTRSVDVWRPMSVPLD